MKKKTEEELLKSHICLQPFRHMEMFHVNATLCCPSWLKKKIWFPTEDGENFDYDVWNSKDAQEVRQSILDGNYKYCDKERCPHLNTLLSTGKPTGMFAALYEDGEKWEQGKLEKFAFPFCDNDGIEIDNKAYVKTTPGSLNFTFDRSCNLQCPSCRHDIIMAKPDEVKKIDKIIDFINNNYAKDCRKIVITGSGDPFASKSFRRFLFEFNPEQWPKLRNIYLVSNGNLFNKKNWDLMEKVQPYIRDVEISIDAGEKDTYENKTRIGGKWETLIENLKFISTIETIDLLRVSFIVQKDNYKEMRKAAELFYEIFKERIENLEMREKTTLFFGRIAQWDHMSDEEIKEKDVANPSHPKHADLIQSLKNVYQLGDKINIQSNLTYLLDSKLNIM